MKPFRITMAHHLVMAYDLHKHLDVYRPTIATEGEMWRHDAFSSRCAPAAMREFHEADYVDFLKRVTPEVRLRSFSLQR